MGLCLRGGSGAKRMRGREREASSMREKDGKKCSKRGESVNGRGDCERVAERGKEREP